MTIATLKNMTTEITVSIKSSCIDEIYIECAKDETSNKTDIVICFKGNRQYGYYDIPFETIVKMMNAESVGKAYNSLIKGRFENERL